ncbi:MAG: alpha/beta fold hydrolase [Chloracidobacterium sp.]|uniref:Alpha/beta fold hydrolase n=1 Tax=Chloracidobacterium validum TaxID=2821543 RepID=A0ABX8BEL9_9BACT|nr:alpha/beta fold hydrolase [Chloracidobacterium validum]QUW04078.1 alpha/beta fold hydrolase [Chloracidobacterium validum]
MTPSSPTLAEAFENWQWLLDGWLLRQTERPLWTALSTRYLNGWLDWVDRSGAAWPWHPFMLTQEARQLTHLAMARAVAPPVATTPCTVAPLIGASRLRRYAPAGGRRPSPAPILIVNSLINRHYIFDLYAGRSFVSFLAGGGQEVFVLDWGTPGHAERRWRLVDVVEGVIGRAVDAVLSQTGATQTHLLGYSMGGVLATTYAVLHPAQVKTLVLMGTPSDFARDTPLRAWLSHPDFDPWRLASVFGNLPGWLVSAAFRGLKPMTYLTKPWLVGLAAAERDTHLAAEVWLADAVPLPGAFYADFVTAYYRDNALWEGKLELTGRRAALRRLDCPTLNLIGLRDQIVNPGSATALAEQLPAGHYAEYQAPLGHLALAIGQGATTTIWPTVAQWLNA